MMRNRLIFPDRWLRTDRLEDRLAPSAAVEIVSRADSTLISETAGGNNYIGPHQPAPAQWTSWQFPLPPVSRTLSLDGRYVVFASTGTNAVAGQVDTNVGHDIFVHDRATGATELISHTPGQPLIASDGDSFNPAISGDGRFVAYTSRAHNLVTGFVDGADHPNEFRNIYVYDRVTGATVLASRAEGSATKCEPDQRQPGDQRRRGQSCIRQPVHEHGHRQRQSDGIVPYVCLRPDGRDGRAGRPRVHQPDLRARRHQLRRRYQR